ncbi:MAG TPA: hypothetical protein VHX61_18435 [Rhizomicrobium sp.]|nr:hypothetical protein [Rhizomicrobium sp.]
MDFAPSCAELPRRACLYPDIDVKSDKGDDRFTCKDGKPYSER